MSYILDALKKIEYEKSKKAHPDGRVSISGDLFQDRKQPTSRAGTWKTVAIIAVVSLVTCAGTWFALRGNSRKSTAVIRQVAPPPSPPVSVNSPIITPPVPVPVQPRSASVSAPSAASPAAVPAAPENTNTVGGDDSPAREIRRSKNQIKAQPPSPKQPAQTVQAPADIKLSGIAWQDERTARRAVINGFLLKEGAVVSGAKIIDIQADRVRFSSSAGQFEIKLDAVLPAEVKK
jgi:general secretion pathway protein B